MAEIGYFQTKIMISRQRQYLNIGSSRACGPGYVCCSQRQPSRKPRPGQCGVRYTQGINGRIKTPSYVDGDSEFGEKLTSISLLFRSFHIREWHEKSMLTPFLSICRFLRCLTPRFFVCRAKPIMEFNPFR